MKGGDHNGEEAVEKATAVRSLTPADDAPLRAGFKGSPTPTIERPAGWRARPDLIIFDDMMGDVTRKALQEAEKLIWNVLGVPSHSLRRPKMEGSGVAINAKDIRHATQMLNSNNQHPYLTIEPLQVEEGYHDDSQACLTLDKPLRARPTERFLIQWNGSKESFTRTVNSVKELYEVLKPIFAAHADSRKTVMLARQKRDKEWKDAQRKKLLETIRVAQKRIDELG